MSSEETLLSLYNLRAKLEAEALKKYQLGLGMPYTPELEEIDRQIEQIGKRLPQSSFLGKKGSVENGTIDLTKKDLPSISMNELLKDARQASQIMADRQYNERLQRQKTKSSRILNSSEDKYIHALKTIIERIEPYYPERKSFRIDYYYFNFEDRMDDLEILEVFLKKLQQAQCFEKFERLNSVGKTDLIFSNINLEKLKEYKDNYDNKTTLKYPSNKSGKLNFYKDDGMAEYKTATASFKSGTKSYELLNYLFTAKNTPLSLADIQKNCNDKINIERYQFKTDKGVEDTIRQIKQKLKVKKSEFFPIYKKNKSFVWLDK